MELTELIRLKRDAIAERWVKSALAAYPEDSAKLFRQEKDPFANPVGHSLREGTRAILDGVIDGQDTNEIQRHLDDIIKIRAVQQMAPSEALGFVFGLKRAIRAELARAESDMADIEQLALLDERVDRVALAAFDVYVACREQVSELRVNEARRSVSWVIDRINQRADRDSATGQLGADTTEEVNVRPEGVR